MKQRRKILSAILALAMLVGLVAIPTATMTASAAFVYGTDDAYNATLDRGGYWTINFEPGTTYEVEALARNKEIGALAGPQRPMKGEDYETNMNKLSFQYESASEKALGYGGWNAAGTQQNIDMHNIYITKTFLEWHYMTFTTPNDMEIPGYPGGSYAIIGAFRHSDCWIAELNVWKLDADGNRVANIFKDSDGKVPAMDGSWGGLRILEHRI